MVLDFLSFRILKNNPVHLLYVRETYGCWVTWFGLAVRTRMISYTSGIDSFHFIWLCLYPVVLENNSSNVSLVKYLLYATCLLGLGTIKVFTKVYRNPKDMIFNTFKNTDAPHSIELIRWDAEIRSFILVHSICLQRSVCTGGAGSWAEKDATASGGV